MKQQAYSVATQRILLAAVIQGFLLLIVFGRLCIIQVFQKSKYETLAEDNRTRIRPIFPKRGRIYDRNQKVLADNIQNYKVILIPEDVEDVEEVLKNLTHILNISQDEMVRIRKSIRQKPRFLPTVIREEVSWDHLCALEVNNLSLPGIHIEEGFKRDYSLGSLGSHVLGYVSAPNEADAQGNKSLSLPGAKIGKAGLEAFYETTLQGTIGRKELEVDARGRLIQELRDVSPVAGQDLYLTIDEELQRETAAAFKEKNVESGGAVVLDSQTGAILALVSVPGFEPNLFYNGIDHKNWSNLLQDPYKPMTNKVIAGRYSPASIFKIIVALAALRAGHNPRETHFCPGHFHLGKHRFHCWKKEGHGTVDLYQAIVKSCDVYFYHLARKIGEKPILDMARRFNLKDVTHIDLPNEVGGFLADPEWKRRIRKEPWYPGDTILTAIGQAYVLTTPLQLAVMMAQVVNGGRRVTPRLIKTGTDDISHEMKNDIVDGATTFVIKALGDVVNSPAGTSYHTRIENPDYAMGGKTGTAQVRRISMQERRSGVRKDSAIPWHLRDNALFVGFAPVESPRYVIAVIAEHKGFGGMVAAPIAGKILLKAQEIMARRKSNDFS